MFPWDKCSQGLGSFCKGMWLGLVFAAVLKLLLGAPASLGGVPTLLSIPTTVHPGMQ